MITRIIAVCALVMLVATPIFVLAQGDGGFTPGTSAQSTIGGQNIEGLANRVATILLGTIVPILFVIGTVMLVYGVIKYLVIGADNEEQRKSGQQMITWGIIGLFLAGAIGGLLLIIRNSFSGTIPESTSRAIQLNLPTFQR
jgi:hypothetical protein